MASIKITKHNFEKEVLNAKEPVLLDFGLPVWTLQNGITNLSK